LERQLDAEIKRRLKTDLRVWCGHALRPVGHLPAAHHRLLIRELQDVVEGRTSRLMINLPPGSAKSTYGSVLMPPWALAQRRGLDIIGASNTSTLAQVFSRRVMGLIRDHGDELGYHLTRENAEEWTTSNDGHYRATGVSGSLPGTRADLAIIDDPTRSRADAESETVRESQWAWFTGDLRTRLKPDAAIIVIMTRWHQDDLGGRLLDRQPGLWKVVKLPAIAGENDPLGRAPGDWLWPDDNYGYANDLRKAHAEYQTTGAMRDWAALYQQEPRPLEGSLFKVGMIDIIDAAPQFFHTSARAWDLAATAQTGTRDPDWTVGVKLTRTREGRYIVTDVARSRGGPDETEALIVNTAKMDGPAVTIGLPQDPGQAGKAQVLYLTRKLSGYRVESSPETGDKATRAGPVASQVNVGNVAMVRGAWNYTFRDELAAFPSGLKDDQVDALSRAFAMVGMNAPLYIPNAADLRKI
jgi:predicted phage terminase large subunit-like protein